MQRMLHPDSSGFVDLIGQIYEAAEDGQIWHSVIHNLGRELGSHVNVLSLEDIRSTSSMSFVDDGIDPRSIREYDEYYYAINFLLERVKPLLKNRPVFCSSE